MKRLHVSVAVGDLDTSVRFYSSLFAAAPSVLKPDYAKWMLDDPRVNFAITARPARKGVDHLGIQVEDEAELAQLSARLAEAGRPVLEQKGTTCCYARSDKEWTLDPDGVPWEAFRSLATAPSYGDTRELEAVARGRACC
jgi:catechol 2,3-dioxygenase-like lactoylglutathione lyase family enzyme